MSKSTQQLEKKRDRLRKNQVHDRREVKRLRDAIEHRGNKLHNVSKRITKRQQAHPDIDSDGLAFITHHEGERLDSYNDGAGNCTVGVGHLLHMGRCTSTVHISAAQSRTYLYQDVQVAIEAIKKYVRVKLNQNQVNALADFIFNIGTGAFASSTLLSLLNGGDYHGAAEQFMRWIFDSNHVAEPGLRIRREDEKTLFLK